MISARHKKKWHLHHEGYHPASSIEKTHHPFLSVLGLKFHEARGFHSTGPLSPPQSIQAFWNFWMLCCPESLQKVTEDSPRCLLRKPVAATSPRIVCQKAEHRPRKKCMSKQSTSETMLHVVHVHTRTSSGIPDFCYSIPPNDFGQHEVLHLNIIICLFTSPEFIQISNSL